MGTWMNSDGLYLKYGTDRATAGTAGEYRMAGNMHTVHVRINCTSLGTAAPIQSDAAVIPKNARIEEVEIVTDTAVTSGGSAVLNIGLIRYDRSTAIDEDGLVAALAIASFNSAGETQTLRVGSTGAGALIGTTTSNPGYISADYDTAAFTAGVIDVYIRYRMV